MPAVQVARHGVSVRTKDRLRALRAAGLRLRTRWSREPVALGLVYHLLADRGGDPLEDVVAPHAKARFAEHLAHLRRHYRPVLASELTTAARARRRGQRIPVAVTFDDDSASHAEHAAPLLAAAAVPATFYLTGGFLDGRGGLWWEEVAALWAHAAPPGREAMAGMLGVEPRALAVVGHLERLPPAERDARVAALAELSGGPAAVTGLDARQVRALAAAGHEIGFHTLRHMWLTAIPDDELDAALEDNRAELAAAAGRPLETIAYPHGQADERVAAAARRAGFTTGFTTRSRRHRDGEDPLLAGRYWPTYRTLHAFAADMAELLAGRWEDPPPAPR